MTKLKELKIFRAKEELKIKFLKVFDSFISVEEPAIDLTLQEKASAILEVLSKKLSR